jgi:hypothetical protein
VKLSWTDVDRKVTRRHAAFDSIQNTHGMTGVLEHAVADRQDEPGFFRDRDKNLGRYPAPSLVPPSEKDFGTGNPAAPVHLRLQMYLQ